MKLYLIIVIIFTVTFKCANQFKNTAATVAVHDRVAVLKYQIAQETKKKRDEQLPDGKLRPINHHYINTDYDYVDKIDEPITPINDSDERKKNNRFKLRPFKTSQQEKQGLTKRVDIKRAGKNKRHAVLLKKNMHRIDMGGKDYKIPTLDSSSSTEEVVEEHTFDKVLGIPQANKKKGYDQTTRLNKDHTKKAGSNQPKSAGRNAVKKNHRDLTRKPKVSHGSDVFYRRQNHRDLTRKPKVSHGSDVFYRRQNIIPAEETNHLARQHIHCQDLISPFLKGQKTNLNDTKRITVQSHTVQRKNIQFAYITFQGFRLMQLIGEDTSDDGKDEIYSILYQISNIQIRLFQWDVPALKLLFNVLNKANLQRHSLRTVKEGVQKTLASWHLDFSNTTNLLKQARVFRPPCIRMPGQAGSTKTSKGIRYTKPDKPKCSREDLEQCDDDD